MERSVEVLAVILSGVMGLSHMRLDIYLNYPGNCEDAFRFYEQHLHAKLVSLTRHADVPVSNPNLPADWKDKVLHARVQIGNSILMHYWRWPRETCAQPGRSTRVVLRLLPY